MFVDGDAIETVKTMVREMDTLGGGGEEKRKFIVDMLKDQLKRGSVYILRALIEVLLAQLREGDNAR